MVLFVPLSSLRLANMYTIACGGAMRDHPKIPHSCIGSLPFSLAFRAFPTPSPAEISLCGQISAPLRHISLLFPLHSARTFCPLLAQQWLFSSLSLCSALPICILLSAAGQCEIIRKSLILASVLSSVLPRFLRVSHSFSCGNFLVRTNIRTPEAHLSPFPSSPCAHFCPLLAQ